MDFDLVVRGGTVVAGDGGPAVEADVGIRGRRIIAVARGLGRGCEEIDARGLLVTPGFVDVHTHYDAQITWEDRLAPSSGHGVTTVVMGNCGVGFAPCQTGDREMLLRLMEGVEDIPDVVMAEGVPWNWRTFPEYLDALSERRADIDFAAQLPHSPLRVFVMGERGANLEPPTSRDLLAMRRLTAEALSAGAVGVSTSRNLAHRFKNGRVAPSVRTEEDELMALADGLADAGAGVFQLIPAGDRDPADEFALIRRLAQRSGRPVSFTLLRAATERVWDCYVSQLREAATLGGPPIRGQFLPRPTGVLLGLDLSFHPFSLNPSFRPLADLPLDAKVAALRDPEVRKRLLAEAPEDPNPFYLSLIRGRRLFELGDPPDYNPPPEQTIEAQARARGVPERELIYDALLQRDGKAILYSPMNDPAETIADAAAIFGEDYVLLGLGDGGAHYGMICDAAYPTYLLAHWVRSGGGSPVTLERAIQALAHDTARAVGFADRGLLRPGFKADVNVIDFDRLHLHAPHCRRDLPASGRRLVQAADGYAATIVSGQVTYRNAAPTGALPGRLVRSAAGGRSHR